MTASIASDPSPGNAPARWRALLDATLVATWALMLVGALTRASMAGVACPDWPLCHGYVVPPIDATAYPAGAGAGGVYEVYLEFSHRVLAAVTSGGAAFLAFWAWRRRLRPHAIALLGTLGLQVLAGAVTVWLGNAPLTVVLHLALGLAFVAVLLLLRRRMAAGHRAAAGTRGWTAAYGVATALTVAQMLVGANVSSSYFGLACPAFPSCEPGRLWPREWSPPVAWQLLHRGVGVLLGATVLALVIAAFSRASGERERPWAALLAGGVTAQGLLGAATVWLQLPAWASALHLGVAVAIFGALASRVLAAAAPAAATST